MVITYVTRCPSNIVCCRLRGGYLAGLYISGGTRGDNVDSVYAFLEICKCLFIAILLLIYGNWVGVEGVSLRFRLFGVEESHYLVLFGTL